ncbi:MAG TPA: HisS family protein [Aggregatilineales bacterium]|nr:HisS family protein [Aggregatilineales bacterium]
MPSPVLGRAPGFYDRNAAETSAAAYVSSLLQRSMRRFGYIPVETPIVEYVDLFLTKSGDEAINRLFTFEMYGRQLCLRPEFTASAARLYIERYQHEQKPIRWQFSGPIFRYEAPQRSHSRQFTMLGAELIGPSGVSGDAEMIGMAARGLFDAGLKDWSLVIGHVGLVGQLLDRFDLDRRTRRLLLGQIENLRRADRGRAYVIEQLEQLYTKPNPLERLEEIAPGVASATPQTPENVSHVFELLLESANLGTTGTGRSNEDVARRLLAKQRRAEGRDEALRALDFLEKLVQIEGTPDEAFPALERMLPADPAIRETGESLRATLDLLPSYGLAREHTFLEMGLARGLNYYTGIVFEGHTSVGDSSSQLFGGGRYDDFIRILGAAQDTPAIGFAYGLERILQELQRVDPQDTPPLVDVLVVPVDESDNAEAARIAMLLRQRLNVELFTPPTRNLAQALAHADRHRTPFVAILGEAERQAGQISVRDMRSKTQSSLPLDDLNSVVERIIQEIEKTHE